jgi:hypothetical protein
VVKAKNKDGSIYDKKIYIFMTFPVLFSKFLLVIFYSYGMVSYKESHAVRSFSDLLCVPI